MRRPLDAYYTPEHVVRDFLGAFPEVLDYHVIEPCAGDGAIAKHLPSVTCYDIDPSLGWPVKDAANSWYYETSFAPARALSGVAAPTCFVTNPPFNKAAAILANLLRHDVPTYLLVRLSFLEPTLERGPLLTAHPPSAIVVTPRISFTGDGHTDSVTTCWLAWNTPPRGVRVIERARPTATT